ncbi:MAG: helix-turn-helix transcriptional regulator [Candidatus Eremiobacteraeota bacterium]|nr:helix-turn-helix transcriptional regulator [Candidatus Eremiobacteraeota bacterium]MBV9409521.1 helix-turn-helix transcriptional regulator [Candidatus Eremiobacteraeota bacterium]
MAKSDLASMPCSIARSLEVVGEWWTILVLRDVFRGIRRFDAIQRDLGIATNVLTARLKRLRDAGLIDRRRYEQRPPRYEYHLTDKGRDLFPLLIALVRWGDKHLAGDDGPPRTLVHLTCGHTTEPKLVCSHCEGEIVARNTRYVTHEEAAELANPEVRAG